MIAERKRVLLYIFDNIDGRSTDDKLRIAADRFLANAEIAAAPDEWIIARTQRGKPYFANCPDVHVSASHSDDYFICAVAAFPVGADIQTHAGLRSETQEETAFRLKRIAKRYFSPAEAEFIREDTCNRFFKLWTARESYVKYTGDGIDGSFTDHCVLPGDEQTLLADPGKIAGWNALGVAFRQLRLESPYTICVCAGEDFSLEVIWLAAENK